ncbi:MAG: hypothetical protein JSW37_14470, partial [Anaerolineales bacterium]
VERLFGCISVGIGKYPFHTDGIIKSPSIWLDDCMMEREGTPVEDDLSALGSELIQSYHGSPGATPACMPSTTPGRNDET